jgi:hypothetical protein
MAKIYQDEEIKQIRYRALALGGMASMIATVCALTIADFYGDRQLRDMLHESQAEVTAMQEEPRQLITYVVNFDPNRPSAPYGLAVMGRTETTQYGCERMREMFWNAPVDLPPGEVAEGNFNMITVCTPPNFQQPQGETSQ